MAKVSFAVDTEMPWKSINIIYKTISDLASLLGIVKPTPLLKKKGIPECILFVTQRLTKYPLLIEPLIKTSKENRQEQEALQKALSLIKEVLVEVDAQVAEKEKEDRKIGNL
ncbi:hypothetical protein NQ317_010493 [Molorchus minor]|uniref:DH domain-containing protein n=1 Tax=Molorchus minor TaxID=1323400 RepID=A0ABQ9JZG0_9CUCU|nr:hypothetical protein NQ317_010493 [Molorchus minor]